MTAIAASVRARVPRPVVVGACVAGGLLLAALVGGRPGREGPPLDPRSDGPLGTSALVSLLERLGAEVELSAGLPDEDEDVALLLTDRLDDAQRTTVVEWVRQGGTLVVTDPGSVFAPPTADLGLLPGDELLDRGQCSIDALAALQTVDGGAAVRFEAPAGAEVCFGDRQGAFVVAGELGRGQVVAIGGAALVTNDLLDEHDNAVLAATVLAPSPEGTVVRFVEAPVPAGGGDKTLGDLVPTGLERGLVQVAVAFVLYALWRAVRLGQPVVEHQPVEVAGSELVAAIGRLLSQTRNPAAAAEALRSGLRRSLRARFAVPPRAPAEAMAEIVSASTSLTTEAVLAAVDDRPVTTDAELVALARAVASVHEEVRS